MTAPRLLEGLPGIDWGSPDTYETADQDPELMKHINDLQTADKDDCVVTKIDASVKDVKSTLKDKFIDASNVDFSDAPTKGARSGYTSGLNLVSGEETASQKLHRIVSELDELSAQLNSSNSGEKKSDLSVADMLKEIDSVRRKVGSVISSQVSQLPIRPSANGQAVSELHRMITTPSDSTGSSSQPVYRLYHHPDSDKQYQLTKAVELEARLSSLESALGVGNTGAVSHVGGEAQRRDGVLDQLSTLESKISLLDPGKLDLIDARLASVLVKMQAVSTAGSNQAAGSGETIEPAKLQKLVQLHELLTSNADQIQILPKVVDRLTALSELHSQAVQMVDAVSFIEKSQSQLDAQLSTCQKLLEGVSRSLEQSSADMADYCRRIEAKSGKGKP